MDRKKNLEPAHGALITPHGIFDVPGGFFDSEGILVPVNALRKAEEQSEQQADMTYILAFHYLKARAEGAPVAGFGLDIQAAKKPVGWDSGHMVFTPAEWLEFCKEVGEHQFTTVKSNEVLFRIFLFRNKEEPSYAGLAGRLPNPDEKTIHELFESQRGDR